MSFIDKATTLEIEFSDGTIKFLSLEGKEDKRQWVAWAKDMYEKGFIQGWAVN